MQDAGGAIVPSEGRNESYHSIVSELVSLIEHVQASMKLLESAIASESAPDGQEAANVVILDDVTPRYAQASAALNSCNASLHVALHVLQDTRTAKHGTDERRSRSPARLIASAQKRRMAMPWRPAEIQPVS
jgi:hypothetical protein